MYIPSHFRVNDPSLIERFIRLNSFATLISPGELYPLATHIPIELEINEQGEQVLWGHVARANPHWQLFQQQPKVLVTFVSPLQHYISSSWYNYKDAPTWNYISVQVQGEIQLVDEDKTWESVRRLTDKHEASMKHPIALDTLPKDVLTQMQGLVAFEIKIEKIDAAFKMSQNRDEENFLNIIRSLEESNHPLSLLVAEMMVRIRQGTA